MQSDRDLTYLLENGELQITPLLSKPSGSSIVLHLGSNILKYQYELLDLRDESTFKTLGIEIPETGYRMKPEEFLLGSTLETVTFSSWYQGFIETKGNIARAGLQIHNTDGHIDPGFSGKITLELKNNSNSSIVIYPNIPIAQLYVFKLLTNTINPYRGRYQGQNSATTYRKDK